MKIFIANDHTGIELKQYLIKNLKGKYQIIDLGTNDSNSSNYAKIGEELANKVVKNNSLGIAICGSGVGISIACNKVQGVRCALIYNNKIAKLAKEHNNANIIAFGAREYQKEEVLEMINIFLSSDFEGDRHIDRINYLSFIEKKQK